MTYPLKALQVTDQELAAPDRSVDAITGAVIDRCDRGAAFAVLGEAGGQVGMMVLDRDRLEFRTLERVLRRQVLGVKVVGDDRGLYSEQAREVLDPVAEAFKRLEVLEVANVVRHPRARVLCDAEGVLELGPAGEHGARGLHGKRDRPRHIAARSSDQKRRCAAVDSSPVLPCARPSVSGRSRRTRRGPSGMTKSLMIMAPPVLSCAT